MIIIKMEVQDSKNLNNFLERVEMKGKTEALAMTRISNALMRAKPEEPKREKVKNNG